MFWLRTIYCFIPHGVVYLNGKRVDIPNVKQCAYGRYLLTEDGQVFELYNNEFLPVTPADAKITQLKIYGRGVVLLSEEGDIYVKHFQDENQIPFILVNEYNKKQDIEFFPVVHTNLSNYKITSEFQEMHSFHIKTYPRTFELFVTDKYHKIIAGISNAPSYPNSSFE